MIRMLYPQKQKQKLQHQGVLGKKKKKRLQNAAHLQMRSCGAQTPARCYLLCCELVRAHGNAVNKLHGTPQAVELHALVYVHHTVGGRRPAPHPVVQEAADARQDDFEHGKAAAQTLFGQQVPLTGNGNLLSGGEIVLLVC